MTRLRKKNGRREPWKVTYWGLGNEMDGPWQMGHRSAEDYGKFALEAAKLMKWTDPNVKLIAAGSSNFGPTADWTGCNRTVLEAVKHHADYLSLHRYVGNADNDYYDFLASSLDLDDKIETAEGIIRASLSGEPRSRKIYIAFDEWNVWYRARGSAQRGLGMLGRAFYNLEDALVVATFLNSFVNHSHIVKIANMAQLVNVIAPIFSNEKGLFLQTIYYPLQLFANNTKGKALELLVDSPRYKTKRFDEVSYLDVSAGYDSGSLVLNVVNRHKDQAMDAEFLLEDKSFSGPVAVTEVNGPDLKSENNFDGATVKSAERNATAQGNTLHHRFAPHSYDVEGNCGVGLRVSGCDKLFPMTAFTKQLNAPSSAASALPRRSSDFWTMTWRTTRSPTVPDAGRRDWCYATARHTAWKARCSAPPRCVCWAVHRCCWTSRRCTTTITCWPSFAWTEIGARLPNRIIQACGFANRFIGPFGNL